MNHFLQHMGAGKNAASKSVKSLLDKKSTRYDFDGDGECDVEEFAALCLTLINHHGNRRRAKRTLRTACCRTGRCRPP